LQHFFLESTHVQSIVRLWWWRGREESGWLQWWWWFDKKDGFNEIDVVHDIEMIFQTSITFKMIMVMQSAIGLAAAVVVVVYYIII
jgi:hypothetical protein